MGTKEKCTITKSQNMIKDVDSLLQLSCYIIHENPSSKFGKIKVLLRKENGHVLGFFYIFADINECIEQNIQCGKEKMCFNQRGDFSCIEIPCPRNYRRDPLTK